MLAAYPKKLTDKVHKALRVSNFTYIEFPQNIKDPKKELKQANPKNCNEF